MNLPLDEPGDEGRATSGAGGTAAGESDDAAKGATPVVRTPVVRTPVVRTPVVRTPVSRTPVSRKTLDEVFGDVLPNVTRDETDDGRDQASRSTDRDRWYRENRPPHHG